MAFDKSKLELLAGGGAVLSLWAYASATDTGVEIDATGYFNAAAAVLKPGDWVLVNASDARGIAVISGNAGGVVDTGNLSAVG
jgi:hypothetical protein